MMVLYKGERARVIAEGGHGNSYEQQFVIQFADGEILSVAIWKCVILAESVLEEVHAKYRQEEETREAA